MPQPVPCAPPLIASMLLFASGGVIHRLIHGNNVKTRQLSRLHRRVTLAFMGWLSPAAAIWLSHCSRPAGGGAAPHLRFGAIAAPSSGWSGPVAMACKAQGCRR